MKTAIQSKSMIDRETVGQVPLFHLAFPVDDLQAARRFYQDVLGCTLGRSSESWIDFNFYGHQIVAHCCQMQGPRQIGASLVDSKQVPVPHFGLILEWDDWHRLADRLKAAQVAFVIEPYIRFAGQVGEQATMFLLDPAGNAIEFKSFRDNSLIFAH